MTRTIHIHLICIVCACELITGVLLIFLMCVNKVSSHH